MANCSLPQWVSYLQALAVPIIAAVGVWIAARQMLIADEKLQLDEFERQYVKRVAVFEATRKFLVSVFREKDFSEDQIQAYALHTAEAQFLFDDKLSQYLGELLGGVSRWHAATVFIAQLQYGDSKDEYEKIRTKELNWITQQVDERTGFAVRFKPFLVLQRPKRPWLLRWP